MKLTIGSIVHYRSYGTKGGEFDSDCRAAIVTAMNDAQAEQVSLAVLDPTGLHFILAGRDEEAMTSGSWHVVHDGSR